MFTPPGSGSRFIHVAQRMPAGVISNEIVGSVPRRLTAMVSAEGTFELADVPPGEYTVTWTSAGSPSAPRTIRVPEGVTTVPVTIQLGSASLAGIVQRPDGSPVTGATVQVKTALGYAQAITGSDGTFSYTALDPGTATVRALARNEGTAQATVELREDAVSEVELKVRPENQSKANVLVMSGGTPVPNAFVFVSQNGRVSASTTSADGRATIRLFDGDGPLHIAAYSGSRGWTFAQPQPPGDGEIAVEMTAGAAAEQNRTE